MSSVDVFKKRYQLVKLFTKVEKLTLCNSLTIHNERCKLLKDIERALTQTQTPSPKEEQLPNQPNRKYFRIYSLTLDSYEKKFKQLSELKCELMKNNSVQTQSGPHFNPKDDKNISMYILVRATNEDVLQKTTDYEVEPISEDLFLFYFNQPHYIPQSDYTYVIIRKYSISQSEAVTFLRDLKNRKHSVLMASHPNVKLSGPYCENPASNGAPFLYLSMPKDKEFTIKQGYFDGEGISWQVQNGNTLNPSLLEISELPFRYWLH